MGDVISNEDFRRRRREKDETIEDERFDFLNDRCGTDQAVGVQYRDILGIVHIWSGLVTHMSERSVTIGGKSIDINRISEYYEVER